MDEVLKKWRIFYSVGDKNECHESKEIVFYCWLFDNQLKIYNSQSCSYTVDIIVNIVAYSHNWKQGDIYSLPSHHIILTKKKYQRFLFYSKNADKTSDWWVKTLWLFAWSSMYPLNSCYPIRHELHKP